MPRNPDRAPTHADWERARERRNAYALACVRAVTKGDYPMARLAAERCEAVWAEMSRLNHVITARENAEALAAEQ